MSTIRLRSRTRHRRRQWATQGLWLGANGGIAGYVLYWLQVLDLEFLAIKREMSFSLSGDLVFHLTPFTFKLLYGFCLIGGTLASCLLGAGGGFLLGKGLIWVWREAHHWRTALQHELRSVAAARSRNASAIAELDVPLLPLPGIVRGLAGCLPPEAAQDYVNALLELYLATQETHGDAAARRRLLLQMLLSAPFLWFAHLLRHLARFRRK